MLMLHATKRPIAIDTTVLTFEKGQGGERAAGSRPSTWNLLTNPLLSSPIIQDKHKWLGVGGFPACG